MYPHHSPSQEPTRTPTTFPTSSPSNKPTKVPTLPTSSPTNVPVYISTKVPTSFPTEEPTDVPTPFPVEEPLKIPTSSSSQPTKTPISTQAPTSDRCTCANGCDCNDNNKRFECSKQCKVLPKLTAMNPGIDIVTGEFRGNVFTTNGEQDLIYMNKQAFQMPKGWILDTGSTSSSDFTSEYYESSDALVENIRKEKKFSVSTSGGGSGNIYGVSVSVKASASYSKHELSTFAKNEERNSNSLFTMTKVKFIYYKIKSSGLRTFDLAPDFLADFNRLPLVYDRYAYQLFVTTRGTHAVLDASFGGSAYFVNSYNHDSFSQNEEFKDYVSYCASLNIKSKVKAPMASGGGSLTIEQCDSKAKELKIGNTWESMISHSEKKIEGGNLMLIEDFEKWKQSLFAENDPSTWEALAMVELNRVAFIPDILYDLYNQNGAKDTDMRTRIKNLLIYLEEYFVENTFVSEKRFTTKPSDVGANEYFALDQHQIRCNKENPLGSFVLKNDSSKIYYDFECTTVRFPVDDKSWMVKKYETALTKDGGVDGRFIYLDQQNIQCPENGVLVSFKMNHYESTNEINYSYECAHDPTQTVGTMDCDRYLTSRTLESITNYKSLSKHGIKCKQQKNIDDTQTKNYLSGFQFKTGSVGFNAYIQYEYECCRLVEYAKEWRYLKYSNSQESCITIGSNLNNQVLVLTCQDIPTQRFKLDRGKIISQIKESYCLERNSTSDIVNFRLCSESSIQQWYTEENQLKSSIDNKCLQFDPSTNGLLVKTCNGSIYLVFQFSVSIRVESSKSPTPRPTHSPSMIPTTALVGHYYVDASSVFRDKEKKSSSTQTGDLVGLWVNKASSKGNLVSPNDRMRPKIQLNEVNGHGVVHFSGSGTHLFNEITYNPPYTFIVVQRTFAGPQSFRLFTSYR